MATSDIKKEKFTYGTEVSVTATTQTAPLDGIIRIVCNPNVSAQYSINIDGKVMFQHNGQSLIYEVHCIQIRAGQTFSGSFTNANGTYIPFISA